MLPQEMVITILAISYLLRIPIFRDSVNFKDFNPMDQYPEVLSPNPRIYT